MTEVSPTEGMKYDVCSIPEERIEKKKKGVPTLMTNKPVEIRETTVFGRYPDLRRVEAFVEYPENSSEHLNKEKVLKYIIILYSEDSVLNKDMRQATLEEKMYQAAEYAGFKQMSVGDYSDEIKSKLFLLTDPSILNAIHGYLEFQYSDIWSEMVIIDHELMEYRRIRMAPVTDTKDKDVIAAVEKKDKLRASCLEMIKQKEAYEKVFYGDDTNLKSKAKKKRVTLEDRARKQ
jgi:hypothetical protein